MVKPRRKSNKANKTGPVQQPQLAQGPSTAHQVQDAQEQLSSLLEEVCQALPEFAQARQAMYEATARVCRRTNRPYSQATFEQADRQYTQWLTRVEQTLPALAQARQQYQIACHKAAKKQALQPG